MKKLVRVREGRVLTGVCAGLARHFNIDVKLVRILTVVLSLLSHGLGIGMYVVCLALMPEEGSSNSIFDDLLGRMREKKQPDNPNSDIHNGNDLR